MNIIQFRLHQQVDENKLAQQNRREDDLERFDSLLFGIDTTREQINFITDY